MAFQAGAINAGAYISCHRFVSHVTGFATLVGTDFAQERFSDAFNMAVVPIFFLIGTMISAYYVDRRSILNKKPQYTALIVIIAFFMYIAAFGGKLDWFGPFFTPNNVTPNATILSILCLTCGIQNATITSASGSVVRTTHLTGITTDLGIGLMRLVSKGQSEELIAREKRGTVMRLGIITSFILGSVIAALIFYSVGYAGYFLPAGTSTFLLLLDSRERRLRGAH